MSDQDWTPVRITRSKTASSSKVVPLPQRTIQTRSHFTPEAQQLRKIEEAEVPTKPKQLAPTSRQEIITRRVANKWSQVELNQNCSFPINTIREIEAGRLCPSIQQLNTLNRVLKCGLHYA